MVRVYRAVSRLLLRKLGLLAKTGSIPGLWGIGRSGNCSLLGIVQFQGHAIFRRLSFSAKARPGAIAPGLFHRVGWSIDELDQYILEIYRNRGLNGLQALPNIGPSLAAFIVE